MRFTAWDYFTFTSISIGNDVYIGPGAHFSATHSSLTIGSKVSLGPNVTIVAGNHNTSMIGRYIYDMDIVRTEDNRPVVIEDDVWVGAGATILTGVHVGRGAIIGAGAIVTRNVPPYAVVVGIPARVIKHRWSIDIILEHEKLLYTPDKRFNRETIEFLWSRSAPLPAPSKH